MTGAAFCETPAIVILIMKVSCVNPEKITSIIWAC